MSHGHVRTRGSGNRPGGRGRRRSPGGHLGVSTGLTGLLGLALVVTTTPPASAAETLSPEAAAARAAVQSLAVTLDGLAATPTLRAHLPLAGQSASDVLGLSSAFATSLGAAASSFDGSAGTDLEGLVTALDAADTPHLGVDAALEGDTITIDLTGKSVTGKAYALHSDEDLFLDGTSAAKGSTDLTGAVGGTLTLTVGADDAVTLDPASELTVELAGQRSDLTIPSRYGFSDVVATGSAAYDVSADFTIVDPDGSGAITASEWQTTPFSELAPVTVGGSADVSLDLDSDLVPGSSNGTVVQELTGSQMVPGAAGDGSYSFGSPTVTPDAGLQDLAKITSGDAIVALSQMAAAYSNAQARIDPRLPLVDTAVSELGSAVDPLNELIEAQGAAAVTCGRADSNPPAVTTVPGTTWYCQARTAEPISGGVQWSVTGGGEIVANATSSATVGTNPTENIAVTGSAVEPDVTVAFDAAGPDGASASFTAQRRVRTAQELAARLSALPGGARTEPEYDAAARALTFPISSDSDPEAKDLAYAFGDLLRPDARLRGIQVDPGTELSVDVGEVAMAGTLGLLLEPTSTEEAPVAVADRAFVAVAEDEPEVSVAGIEAAGSFGADKATGMVGMTKVALAGEDITISTGDAPALRADIEATGGLADGEIEDAAMLSDVLSGQDAPATVETVGAVAFTAAGTLTATADELPDGVYTAALDYPVDLEDTLTEQPEPPTVSLSSDWADTLKAQDVAPQVTGTASAADTTGAVLTDGGAAFLDGALGANLSSGDVLTLNLVNLRTGAQCSSFQVTATTLTCVEQGQTTGTDLTPTWVESTLAGGKVADPTKLKNDDNFDNYTTDNSWKAGDPYLIEGDPTAVRSVALGGLYEAADGIQRSEEPAWVTPIPMLGIAPKDLAPQLEGIRQAAAEVNNLGDEPRPEDCGDDPGGCPDKGELETAPADLAALEARVDKALTEHEVTGATTDLDIERVDGTPMLVLDVTAPASGNDTDLAMAFALENDTDYWLRQAEGGTPIKPTWSSEVRLRIAVPTTPDVAFDQVQVLSGSGVTKMRVQVGTETVDLNAGLGPVDVEVGVAGALTGTAQDPEPNPVVRASGTVTVSGTAQDAGTTLTDADTVLANLAGADAVATRTSDGVKCTAGDASGDGLECDLPDDETDPDNPVVRDWAAGDAYTLSYSSTTWLTDTTADFTADGVVAGDLVRTHTGAGDARETAGVCEVKTVLAHQLECAAPLSNDVAFSDGVSYQVLPNVLVDPGAGFGDADLVGQVVTNTTSGATCTIASATDTYLSCDGGALTGGSRDWFEPGDEYAVDGASTLKADVGFTFVGDTDALVATYISEMTAELAAGAGAPVSCGGNLSGAICAALSVRTEPTEDRPSGQALGIVKYQATISDGEVTETTSVANAIKNLKDGTTPLALGGFGDAFADAGSALVALADESTDDTDIPLVGSDATAGSWLVPLLDAYGLELGETMMSGVLGNLPETTPLDDVDGEGTSLVQAIEDAAEAAAAELETEDGESMGEVLSIAPVITCGAAACDPSTKTVGDVTAIELPMQLGKEKTTYQVPFESGLAGLPVSADFLVNSEVEWGLDLTLGIDRETGPYVDLSDSKLALDAGVAFPTPDEYEGTDSCPTNPVSSAFDAGSPFADYNKDSCQSLTLGLLQATAYDGKGDDRSRATVDLDIDLDKAVNGTAAAIAAGELKDLTTSQRLERAGTELTATGRLNVYFVTGINPRNPSPDAALPSVHGVLDMKFNPDGKNVWDIDLDQDWSIDYTKLYLDAGTFVDKFAGDVITGAAKQVKPYKPLIDAVRAPVPVISDIAMMMGQDQVSLLDILEGASGSDLSFVRKVIEVLDVVANITPVGRNMLIPLGASEVPTYDPVDINVDFPIPDVKGSGSFKAKPKQNKSGPCGGTMTLNKNPQASGANGVGAAGTQQSPQATKTTRRMPKDCTSTDKGRGVLRGKTKVIQTQPCDPQTGCTGKERAATISARIGKPKLTGTAITFPFMEDFGEVFGLLMGEDATLVRLDLGTLRASAGIGLKFGPFMAGPVPVDIGVGVSVTFGAHLALGYDTFGLRNALLNNPGEFDPSAMLDGLYIDDYDAAGNETPEMTLTLAVQLEGSVSVKIFRVGIYGGVSITIAGDLNDPNGDGKLRIKEIRAVDNPICLFELSGWLDFFFGFFVEVDLFIKTFRYDVELYRLKPPLKLFELKCEPKPPVLAVEEGKNLRLKMGESHVSGRNISEDEPKERFKIRQLSERGKAKDGGTLVSVEAFGIYQEHLVPAGGRIVADAGSADDTIEMSAGVDLQNNTHLFTVPATVNGGDGNDAITVGNGDDVVNGGNGNDRIAGNDGADTLNGDGDDDIVSGGLGDDTIGGGDGNDNLSGDNGGDTVDGGAGDDQVTGGPGLSRDQLDKLRARWVKTGKGPEPTTALMDLADTLSGGVGDDRITGHLGDDTIFGDEPVSGDFRAKACADDAGTGSGQDVIDGQAGNDWIAGGASDDTLTGWQGDDTLCGNAGDDLLEGDEGPTTEGSGQDELRGGDGDDRMFGRGGRDYADGGPGKDMIAAGTGADVALGGTGSDAVNAGAEGDIVLGDTGSVAGVVFNSSDVSTVAGVKSTGLSGTPVATELESKVSGEDTDGAAGTLTSCVARVVLLRGDSGGAVDLNGDGRVDTEDDGRLDGYSVVDGKVDIDGDGDVVDDADDAGVVADRVVNLGLFDIPADMAIDALAWSGSGDADCLFAQDGNDAVFGGAGGDRIAEGDGDGLAVGGAGDDTVRGEAGADVLRGSSDDDTILGDAGNDRILGGAGDDTAYAGTGSDLVEGNEDDDTLYGGEGIDALVGGTSGAGTPDGDDVIHGGEDLDYIAGDNAVPVRDEGVVIGLQLEDVTAIDASGADRLLGGSEDDRIYGQGGQDVIRGESGEDDVEGGPGRDTIHGDDGDDTITGGSGVDTTTAGQPRTWEGTVDTGDELYGDSGNDTVLGDNGIAASSELFDVPSQGADPDVGSSGDDEISGGTGEDRVHGQSGDDALRGDEGADVIDGNSGADTLRGGDDDDVLVGGSQQARAPEDTGAGVDDRDRTVAGETRGDLIRGDAGDDVILGDNGRVAGTAATAVVEEYDVWRVGEGRAPNASGADQLYGDAGQDRVYGQDRDDLMSGGDDDDAMSGGSGADTMAGNAGADDVVGGSGLAQLPVDLARVNDDGDTIVGGDSEAESDDADGADVILGDNGRISRTGATDPNTGQAVREVTLYDLAVAGSEAPPTAVSGGDRIWGNADRDLVYGQGGADTIVGGDGDDWLEGSSNPVGAAAAPDVIRGGAGDDDVLGGSSNDVRSLLTVTGKVGRPGAGGFPSTPNRVLDGDDRLWGDEGDDAVLGDNGRVDRVVDEGGEWTYHSYEGSADTAAAPLLVRTVLGPRADEGEGTWGDDEGHGGEGHDELYGGLGDDRFEGNAGDDSLLGDLGEVVTSVRTGPARLLEAGGFIKETVDVPGTLERRTTTYPVPTSVADGGAGGDDLLLGGLGNDVLHGGAGDDRAWGNRTFDSDLVPTTEAEPAGTSGLDDDVLFGGHGDDQVWGGWHHDRLYGGHGDDRLDLVTSYRGEVNGDPAVDFKGMDFMYGGWGADAMQADRSKPSPDDTTDKMVDATGAYNGYFVCEGAYGGNSIMRLLSPSMEDFWHEVAAHDGLTDVGSSGSSGWWELGMVFNKDRSANANPKFSVHPAHFVCDAG